MSGAAKPKLTGAHIALAQAVKNATQEIRSLRRQNELQAARLSGFDDALHLVNAAPRHMGGIGPAEDAAWRLERDFEDFLGQ